MKRRVGKHQPLQRLRPSPSRTRASAAFMRFAEIGDNRATFQHRLSVNDQHRHLIARINLMKRRVRDGMPIADLINSTGCPSSFKTT
jgi:hypothetical protein